MTMQPMLGAPSLARRELRREEIAGFGSQLDWLQNPALIPEEATTLGEIPKVLGADDNPYFSLAWWMIKRVEAWSEGIHSKLSYGSVFAKYELPNQARVEVRDSIRNDVRASYGTGIMAVSEIYSVTPLVATREGVDDQAQWNEIASQARLFGREIAHHGSNVMGLIREYLVGGYYRGNDVTRIDPAKIKLDARTGITTVTPINEIIKVASLVVAKMTVTEGHSGVCVGLQSVPVDCQVDCQEESMFDLVWEAYGVPAGKYIYSKEKPGDADDIPAPEKPDSNLHETLKQQLFKAMHERN